MMNPYKLALIFGVFLPFTANATVSISFGSDSLRTSAGAFAPTNTLAMLIADPDNDGFGSIAAGDINQYDTIGSNDVVVARFDFSGAGLPGVIFNDATGIQLNGFNSGDQLGIAWFPGLTTSDSSVSANQSYGLLTSSLWIVPPDTTSNPEQYQVISTTNQMAFSSNPVTLNVTDAQSQASLNVVPEPGTYAALAGLAVLGFVALRRRQPRR